MKPSREVDKELKTQILYFSTLPEAKIVVTRGQAMVFYKQQSLQFCLMSRREAKDKEFFPVSPGLPQEDRSQIKTLVIKQK